jgi:hypothetical protein
MQLEREGRTQRQQRVGDLSGGAGHDDLQGGHGWGRVLVLGRSALDEAKSEVSQT